jgi:hypothetical protein
MVRVLSGLSVVYGCDAVYGKGVKQPKKRAGKSGSEVIMRARTSMQLLLDTFLGLEVSRNKFDPSTELFVGTFSIDRSESIERRIKKHSG